MLPLGHRKNTRKSIGLSQLKRIRAGDGKISRDEEGRNMVDGYCMRCKATKVMKNEKEITMKNGRPATKGECPDCGTKIFRIGKAK
jgi:hypothetical protein